MVTQLLTPVPRQFGWLLCGCQSLTHECSLNSPMTFLPYPPKRDSLLCVARHKAVTRTCSLRHYARALCLRGRTFRSLFSPGTEHTIISGAIAKVIRSRKV